MSLWIISASLIALPLVLTLRGAGLLALCVAAMLVYGLYLAMSFVSAFILPEPAGSLLMAFLTGTSSGGSFGATSSFAIVAIGRSVMLAILIFGGLSLLLLVLRRWIPTPSSSAIKALFWALHLSFVGVFVYAAFLFGVAATTPPFDEPPASSFMTDPNVLALMTLAQFAFAVVLILTTGWGSFRNRSRHAV